MIKRYSVKDSSKIKEVISIENLDSLGSGGFLVIILNSLSIDDANDLTEELAIRDVQVPVVVSTFDMTIHEVLDKLEAGECGEQLYPL